MLYKREGDGNQPISNITNVNFRTDELFPSGHPRLIANSGNEMWHTDSSFKPVPAYCSMLSGREVPHYRRRSWANGQRSGRGARGGVTTCRAARSRSFLP